MPQNNMPDARTVNEALRRAREMQSRAPTPPVPPAPEPAPPPEPAAPSAPLEASPPAPGAESPQKASPLDAFLKDKERTLLLALLILLSGEDGNMELMFAIMYLLM